MLKALLPRFASQGQKQGKTGRFYGSRLAENAGKTTGFRDLNRQTANLYV